MNSSKTKARPPHRRPGSDPPSIFVTKDGSRMHVYAKPTDMSPVATFVKDGPWWKKADQPDERYRDRVSAANSAVERLP
jgi:hypothetical protein